MKQYQDLLRHILANGTDKGDRTGTGTRSVFGYQCRFDLAQGFPLVTTKRVPWKAVVHELLWFLRGDTNIKYLRDNGVSIWNEWADEWGSLGPIYGKQWRSWNTGEYETDTGIALFNEMGTIDQIQNVIDEIRINPDSRRLVVSAWNVAELDEMALAPCHCLFQFYVQDSKLSCQLYQRSADCFLGVPFNIASYALLTHMIANITGLAVGEFVHTFGDAHIYSNHMDQVHQLLEREPLPLPQLTLNPYLTNIDDYSFADIELMDYTPFPPIRAPVAV